MKQLDSAGIVVFKMNDGLREYLLLHYQAGHWDFAKGKIEPYESKKRAAHRELHEETGLKAVLLDEFEQSYSYIFTDTDNTLVRKVVHFFLGKVCDSMVKISHEHQDFIWLPYDKAMRKLTYDNAKQVLRLAELCVGDYL